MGQSLYDAKYFFKFFEKKEYARQLINDGCIYMNTADYFRKLETKENCGRYDNNEGILISENDNARLSWADDNGRMVEIGTITSMGFAPNYCIYCLYTAFIEDIKIIDTKDSITIDNRIIKEFGQYVVMIKAQEFINRVNDQIKKFEFELGEDLIRRIGYKFDLVEYKELSLEEKANFLTNGRDRMFIKDPQFAYQKETRLCLAASKGMDPLKLYIGDISDISCFPKLNNSN